MCLRCVFFSCLCNFSNLFLRFTLLCCCIDTQWSLLAMHTSGFEFLPDLHPEVTLSGPQDVKILLLAYFHNVKPNASKSLCFAMYFECY